jgi:photosystem II stability/assembly factor-like uncharacterized protein
VYSVEVHPVTPSIVYAATRGGLHRSVDSGATWQRIENGIGTGGSVNPLLALDRESPSQLWTVNFGTRLFRSADGGDNWTPTGWMAPTGASVLAMADIAGGSGGLFVALSDGQLLRSNDAGNSFVAVPLVLPAEAVVSRLWTDSANPAQVVASIEHRGAAAADPGSAVVLWRSVDNGGSWAPLLNRGATGSSFGVSYDAGPGLRRYASVDDVIWRSDDDGATWATTGLSATQAIAHPSSADTVFLISQFTAGAVRSLARSTDGGVTALPMETGLTPNPTYGGAATVAALTLHPGYPTVPRMYAATQDAGLYVSANDGVSFATAHEGIAAVNVRALAVLPNPAFSGLANRRLFVGQSDAFTASPALFSSTNSGQTFSVATNGLQALHLRSLVIDPTTVGNSPASLASTVIYAGGRSATFPSDQRRAGLYKSSDGGASWSSLGAGVPQFGVPPVSFLGTVRQILLDPRSCASPPVTGACISGPLQTVFATSNGHSEFVVGGDGVRRQRFTHRILRSGNAGALWSASDSGLPDPIHGPATGTPPNQFAPLRQIVTPVPIVMSASNTSVLYAGTFISGSLNPGSEVSTIPSGVFKSVDGGATWTHASNGLPRYPGSADTAFDVLALAIHPTNSDIAWASAVNLQDSINPRQGFVYKTIDGGATWTNASTGINTDADIRALLVDSGNPNTLYASGAGSLANPGLIYRSDDGGASWRSVSVGLPADSALTLHLDPFNPTLLYAGTNASLWQIEQVPDADGDGSPDQVEGNAPNGGDGDGDGAADALQADVGSSIVLLGGRDGVQRAVAGSFTARVVSGTGAGCERLSDVQGVVAARNGRDWVAGGEVAGRFHTYPQDLVRFELRDCSAATVDLRFHAPGLDFGDYGWTLRMYGPLVPGNESSVGWHDLSALATRVDARTWRVQLAAGAFGSYRPGSDSILFVGGPAFYDDRVFSSGFEASP